MKIKIGVSVFLFSLLLIISGIVATTFGVVPIPFIDVVKILLSPLGITDVSGYSEGYVLTILQLRVPRVIFSILAGASLAICGAVFQSVFRNPICDPYIIGISSGASLGAAIAFILGWDVLFWGYYSCSDYSFIDSISYFRYSEGDTSELDSNPLITESQLIFDFCGNHFAHGDE